MVSQPRANQYTVFKGRRSKSFVSSPSPLPQLRRTGRGAHPAEGASISSHSPPRPAASLFPRRVRGCCDEPASAHITPEPLARCSLRCALSAPDDPGVTRRCAARRQPANQSGARRTRAPSESDGGSASQVMKSQHPGSYVMQEAARIKLALTLKMRPIYTKFSLKIQIK